jgi:hypothetical protein
MQINNLILCNSSLSRSDTGYLKSSLDLTNRYQVVYFPASEHSGLTTTSCARGHSSIAREKPLVQVALSGDILQDAHSVHWTLSSAPSDNKLTTRQNVPLVLTLNGSDGMVLDLVVLFKGTRQSSHGALHLLPGGHSVWHQHSVLGF